MAWPQLQGMDLPDQVEAELPASWLEYKVADGMYCTLCTSKPCILLRLESVVRHSETQMHRSAAKEELNYQLASIDGALLRHLKM